MKKSTFLGALIRTENAQKKFCAKIQKIAGIDRTKAMKVFFAYRMNNIVRVNYNQTAYNVINALFLTAVAINNVLKL